MNDPYSADGFACDCPPCKKRQQTREELELERAHLHQFINWVRIRAARVINDRPLYASCQDILNGKSWDEQQGAPIPEVSVLADHLTARFEQEKIR